jgi:uncharacterized protein YcbK (DUF882 family)
MADVAVAGRRRFLTVGAGILGAAMLPKLAMASPSRIVGERKLSFYNTHTGESLKTVYWAEGDYVPEALRDLNKLLRDFRTGDVAEIDPGLFDLVGRVRGLTEAETKPIHIISGYRSPKTNSMLRSHSNGVASKSLHQVGKAIDIRIPGVELDHLRKAALSIKGGGVGYYPASDFVHMDTGRVRFW